MRELKEKWIKEFVSLGKEIEHNGQKVRPNTRTSIAIGKIASLEEVGKNNLKCTLKVSGAKFAFSGFINDNSPVAKLLKQAHENDVTVCVRFERKRKKNADPLADIMDLTKDTTVARDNVIWITAGVYNFSTSEWILSDDAVSNPAEDPTYVKIDIEAAAYNTQGFFESSAPKIRTTDKDKKAEHLITMYYAAVEQAQLNKQEFTEDELKVIAKFMLMSADELQKRAKNISEPNYGDYSHVKARSMVFKWIELNPLTKEIMTTKGEFNKWIAKSLEDNLKIWNWAAAEAEK